ncbi:Uncharacterised protein [Citrobacter freundii]|jgi:hypothetical protein|nr:Uncharacterised protein [Citrobacter freundii]
MRYAYQAYGVARCRPDKAFAPHPAKDLPDGATLIRPT